ncbi:unnamed protein product [Withania somnifera]
MAEAITKNPENRASASLSSSESELDELQLLKHAPPFWKNRKRLSKQLSMCETPHDIAWEKRRIHILDKLTDEDLNELKGCIELGFGFNEEEGQRLCNTLPALDLYFAVNRQYSTSPISSPGSKGSLLPSPASSSTTLTSLGGRSSSFGSPRSESSDAWKIFSPGDDPQQVKTKLRHWAQAVACSVMQSH